MYTFGYCYVNQLNFGKEVSIIKVKAGQKIRYLDRKSPVSKEVKTMLCPDCKKDVKYNRVYCPHCSADLAVANKKAAVAGR